MYLYDSIGPGAGAYKLTVPYRILDPVTDSFFICCSPLHSKVSSACTIRWTCEIEAIPGFAIQIPEEPVPLGGDGEHLTVW